VCSSLKVDRRFRGTSISSGSKNKPSKITSVKAGGKQNWFLAWLIIQLCRRRRRVPPKRRSTLNGLHGFICQEIKVIISTAVSTSDPV
jgi:hypothetical protein